MRHCLAIFYRDFGFWCKRAQCYYCCLTFADSEEILLFNTASQTSYLIQYFFDTFVFKHILFIQKYVYLYAPFPPLVHRSLIDYIILRSSSATMIPLVCTNNGFLLTLEAKIEIYRIIIGNNFNLVKHTHTFVVY